MTAEARDDGKGPAGAQSAPNGKASSAPNISSAEAEKPWSTLTPITLSPPNSSSSRAFLKCTSHGHEGRLYVGP